VTISAILLLFPRFLSISWFLCVKSLFSDSFSLSSSFSDYLSLSFGLSITLTSFSRINSTLFSSAETFFVLNLFSFFSEFSRIIYLLFSSCSVLIRCCCRSMIFYNSRFFSSCVLCFFVRCRFSRRSRSISLQLAPNSISVLAAVDNDSDSSWTASPNFDKSLSRDPCIYCQSELFDS